MQVAVDHGGAEALGEGLALLDPVGHDDAAAGHDHGELRLREHLGGLVEGVGTAGTALEGERLGDLDLDLAVEEVAGDVELGRADVAHRAVEAAGRDLGHALVVVDVAGVLHELLEHRKLLSLLESAESLAHGAGLRSDDDDRRMRPEGGGDGGDAVADARAVLRDDHAMATARARVAVGHVGGTLLMHDGNQSNPRGSEDIHGIHERRAHDAEHVGDAVRDERLDEGLRRRHLGDALCHGPAARHGCSYSH